MVEPLVRRPAVERPRGAGLPFRREMPLAERGGGIAILAEDLRHERATLRDDAGISRIARGEVGDDTHAGGMMIPSGEQGRARGRAHGGHMKAGVPKPARGEPVQSGSRDQAAERARLPVAGIVEQNEQDVRGIGRALLQRKLPGTEVLYVCVITPVNGGRGRGRISCAMAGPGRQRKAAQAATRRRLGGGFHSGGTPA